MGAQFVQLTDIQVNQKGFMNEQDINPLVLLQRLPYVVVTDIAVAGASDATAAKPAFIMPCKGEILEAKFIITKVQTGSGNTPAVRLVHGATPTVVGTSAAIALSGAIGDAKNIVLDAAKTELAAGTVVVVDIVNPAGTITVALEGKFQITWKPKA
jgi:hypothetical protein